MDPAQTLLVHFSTPVKLGSLFAMENSIKVLVILQMTASTISIALFVHLVAVVTVDHFHRSLVGKCTDRKKDRVKRN